ncbi:DUF1772-domain-containing protein [Byssothecium circinans]|uniref:DUF1772-domain-containing protein n=1 Tax=Byssothecium circinans TaxID=147558 RepID=A0A6A5TY84_9PLEO|nr:DUF1772-domain-containing protein [Byssothecium circinans]
MVVQPNAERPSVGVPATAFLMGAFLSGFMMSLSAITIPVLLDTNTVSKDLLNQWLSLFHYGHTIIPTCAMGVAGLHVLTALRRRAASRQKWRLYAAAAVSTVGIVPFTFIFMSPTNNTLFRLSETSAGTGDSLKNVRQILIKWTWMHVARALFPLYGAVTSLVGVLQELGW